MLAAAGLAERLATDVQGVQALRAKAAANDPEALRAAAKQFEAMLVQTLLKTMRETRFTTEDDPFAPSDSLKLYQELLDQQWAQRISAQRGMGFADMMLRQLGGYGADEANSAVPPRAAGPATQPAVEPAEAANDASGSAAALPPAADAPRPGEGILDRKRRFLERLRPHAEAAEQATGVPARFILAHAALESGWGERELGAAAGRASHNLFGIKAGASWSGEGVDSLTTEYRDGLPLRLQQRFRAYPGYTEAFMDYAALLKARYGGALQAGGDARAFARGLADGGYATDPAYADKLLGVIASVARAGA